MPVINNTELEKYKTYYTEKVKGKDGIIRPLTKVKYEKECPQCGGEMNLDKHRTKGSSFIRWQCIDKNCKHSEREENLKEKLRK